MMLADSDMKKILFGIILIFTTNQSVHGSESIINKMIDDDFVAWSNSIPKEEAEIQLKDFLSSFDSWDEAKEWLISKGFEVRMKSRLMSKNVSKKLYSHPRVYANTVFWDTKKKGAIFANSWFLKLESKIFVYGVSVGVHYVVENGRFTVYRVRVVGLRL